MSAPGTEGARQRDDHTGVDTVPAATSNAFVRPFAALRPAPGRAGDVAAPPYDVVTAEEARDQARGRPWSFLHISRPEIDLPSGADPYGPEAYGQAANALRAMVEAGVLIREQCPCYYVYRLNRAGHEQTGIAAAASVDAYRRNRIRRHEHTRPDKEADRARQIAAVAAHTGPVFTVHRPNAAIATLIDRAVSAAAPAADVTDRDQVRHRVWPVADPAIVGGLSAAFAAMEALYIADGHHRAAAAARVAEGAIPGSGVSGGAAEEARALDGRAWFLVVSFPSDAVRILDYNRVVRDLGGRTAQQFLEALTARFRVEAEAAPVRPRARGEFGMVLDGRWYRLAPSAPSAPGAEPTVAPLDRLDVSVLSRLVLSPMLGIDDPRTDPRIDFVGGSRGVEDLERRVRSGEWAAGFSLFPTSLDDLMAVADAGDVMPPKSTWFDPKLADGLLSLPLT